MLVLTQRRVGVNSHQDILLWPAVVLRKGYVLYLFNAAHNRLACFTLLMNLKEDQTEEKAVTNVEYPLQNRYFVQVRIL